MKIWLVRVSAGHVALTRHSDVLEISLPVALLTFLDAACCNNSFACVIQIEELFMCLWIDTDHGYVIIVGQESRSCIILETLLMLLLQQESCVLDWIKNSQTKGVS